MDAAQKTPPPLYLRPRLSERTEELVADAAFLHGLVDALGSPLGVLLPQQLHDNLRTFQGVYQRHSLRGEIFFAHKANRSSALVRELAATGARIDVASIAELQHALGSGFTPDRIMATGPKTPEFLWLAARTGIQVNADSAWELRTLAELVARHGLAQVPVLLRFSGFAPVGVAAPARRSRFGSDVSELDELLAIVDKYAAEVRVIGVAYHLDSLGLDDKATALEGCLRIMQECAARGHRPSIVDIGGGFGVNYLADGAEWERYTSELTSAVLGRRDEITWQGYGYGLRVTNGRVQGTPGVYPGHRPVSGAAYLDALLSEPAPELGRPLSSLMLDSLADLYIEPGRPLLDQCGVVLGRVLEVRDTAYDDTFIRVEMNAGDAILEEFGLLMDPVLIPREPVEAPTAGSGYLIGNLCLEGDFISRRRVWFAHLPQPGDLLAFPNAAGYLMDFKAHHAIDQPVATKVAAFSSGSRWHWCHDDQYWPTTPSRMA